MRIRMEICYNMRHESITQYRFDEIMDKKQTRIRAEVMEQDSAIVPKSSKSWKYESISGSVDGVPAKTNFTIVSVNVKLKNTNEKTEETVGAMMRTNSPVAVSFEISPKSLPKDVDAFKLSCDDLYVKVRAGDKENLCIPGEKGRPAMYYKRVDTNKVFKRGELCGNNKFFVICTKPSLSWLGGEIWLAHANAAVNAVDKACYTCYSLAFVTPFGSPEKYLKDEKGQYVKTNSKSPEPADWYVKKNTSEESDSGDGQNEFCFDDSTQKLEVRLEVGITPKPNDEIAQKILKGKTGVFTVEKLRDASGNGIPSWDDGSVSLTKKVVAEDGKFSAKATYRGYPLRNDGFGLYRAKFSGLGEPLTAEYEVFFDKDGVRHPSCSKCPRCPNWFYYWKDGAVPALAADDVRFSETLPAEKLGCHDNHYLVVPRSVGARIVYKTQINKDVVLIAKAAAVEGTKQYPLSKTAIGNSIYPSIIVGKPEKYVGLVTTAASCAHEKMHQKVFHDLCEAANAGGVILQSLDVDGDGVIDDKELTSDSGYYFKTSTEKPDTYGFATQEPRFGEYAEYGDNEINARMAERFAYEYDIFKDWARPGCQSKKFHGPIR